VQKFYCVEDCLPLPAAVFVFLRFVWMWGGASGVGGEEVQGGGLDEGVKGDGTV
jgi:hypothetical protein